MFSKNKMPSILLIANANPIFDPRPNRMINYFLLHNYQLTVIGSGQNQISGAEYIPLFSLNRSRLPARINFLLKRLFNQFESMAWTHELKSLKKKLLLRKFDLVFCHDLLLLPLALKLKKTAKVVFDAREFYPENFSDRWLWCWIIQPFNQYLCKKYLGQCDKIITVSDGLAKRYESEFGVKAEVFMSLPSFHDLTPTPTNNTVIKMIYHGHGNKSRRIDNMIKMMDYLDPRFHLDLLLTKPSTYDFYFKKLVSMCKKRKNVSILDPIPMSRLIHQTNTYDIGLFLCPPINFNLKFALPNKLFEYIQAQLAVAIGPSIEMRKIVEKYKCGIVSSDFKPETLAKQLNMLTVEKIMYYKEQSHKAALELNAEENYKKLELIIKGLLT